MRIQKGPIDMVIWISVVTFGGFRGVVGVNTRINDE